MTEPTSLVPQHTGVYRTAWNGELVSISPPGVFQIQFTTDQREYDLTKISVVTVCTEITTKEQS